MNQVQVSGRRFQISYDGQSIVQVRQMDTGDFDEALQIVDNILSKFRRSKPGSEWGCDGIGYVIEKKNGIAFRKKSGVGKVKFAQGMIEVSKMEATR